MKTQCRHAVQSCFSTKDVHTLGKLRAMQSQQPVRGRVKWQTAGGTTCAANSSHHTPRTTQLIATFPRICVNLGRGVSWRKVGAGSCPGPSELQVRQLRRQSVAEVVESV